MVSEVGLNCLLMSCLMSFYTPETLWMHRIRENKTLPTEVVVGVEVHEEDEVVV